jgi:hypothetical protein
VNQGGAASGQAWQFMGGGPPLIPLAAETVKAKKLEEKKMYSYLPILLSSLPPSSTPCHSWFSSFFV